MKVRKRPIVLEAEQTHIRVVIPTLEGDMTAEPGDWIITGVKGERYPCKPDIFKILYERIAESDKPESSKAISPESLGTGGPREER